MGQGRRCGYITQASKKSVCSCCGHVAKGYYDKREYCVRDLPSGGARVYLEFEYRRVLCVKCKAVKQETLKWLAEGGRFTQRFEDEIGRQCRDMTVKRVAEINHLNWDQVRRMEISYMRKLLVSKPISNNLYAIGMDEISIRKRHVYQIVVADLVERRPIWMGGDGRKEQDLDKFYDAIGPERKASIRLAVMDMWKPFRNSTIKNAPSAEIVFDKFHIIQHLSKALDKVRRSEYKRVNGRGRKYIKGQKYTLLSNKTNLNTDGRRSLKLLLKANRRLHKAYLLKESFDQLWDYKDSTWAKKFFDNWKAQLRWQRLKPYEKFAAMIERHWHGIVSYCDPNNKVSLGFMEGLNNKIRVIQRRAYGIKNREYLMLKVLTSFIKEPSNDPQ